MAVTHAYSSPIADATGTQTIWYGATTATVAATDNIRPSNWNEAHAQLVTLSGNTVGVSLVTGTNIVFAGTNNVTLSGVQGVNAGTIHISAAAGGGGGSVNVSAGTTSNNLTNFVFADSNGVSFGLNGSTVTATVRTDYQSAGAYLTTARASNDAIGLNTAQSNVTWTANSAGLSLDARGYAGTGTTFNGANLSGSMTVNSNGVQLSVSAGNYLTSQSNQAVSANNGSYAFQTLSFSNANGVSFGTSAGSAITASHNAITTARASTDAIGLNTAQTNVTWTVNSAGLSLNAAGYAGTGTTFNGANVSGSMTVNSVGVQLSLSAGAAGGTNLTAYAQSNTTQSSSGTIALSSLNFAGAGIASVGVSNGSVIVSVPAGGGAGDGGVSAGVSNLGNTLGSTGIQTAGNFVLVGSNGVTLSQSTAGGNATVTIQGAPYVSLWEPFYWVSNNTASQSNMFMSTSHIQPVSLPLLSASFVRLFASMTTNSTSFGTTANTTFSMSKVSTLNAVMYSLNTGASSQSLVSVASGSGGLTQQWSLQAGTAGSQYTVTIKVSYPITGGTSSYSTSYATSQTRFDISSNSITLFSGNRNIDIPFAASFSEGQYWLALNVSTNTGTQATNAFTNAGFGIQGLFVGGVVTAVSSQLGLVGNATQDFFLPGRGGMSSNGVTVSGFAISNASLSGSGFLPYFQMRVT